MLGALIPIGLVALGGYLFAMIWTNHGFSLDILSMVAASSIGLGIGWIWVEYINPEPPSKPPAEQ